jgi:hypothetical protein
MDEVADAYTSVLLCCTAGIRASHESVPEACDMPWADTVTMQGGCGEVKEAAGCVLGVPTCLLLL